MHLSVGERLTGCTWIRTEAKRVHLGGRQGADRVLRPWFGERGCLGAHGVSREHAKYDLTVHFVLCFYQGIYSLIIRGLFYSRQFILHSVILTLSRRIALPYFYALISVSHME